MTNSRGPKVIAEAFKIAQNEGFGENIESIGRATVGWTEWQRIRSALKADPAQSGGYQLTGQSWRRAPNSSLVFFLSWDSQGGKPSRLGAVPGKVSLRRESLVVAQRHKTIGLGPSLRLIAKLALAVGIGARRPGPARRAQCIHQT